MPYQEVGQLKYYSFELFNREDLVHGIFTRHGGVSPAPWASLNLGGTVGDARANVVENRRLIFDLVGRPVETIYDPWQVHGTDVVCVEAPRSLEGEHTKADAILTDKTDITLFMRFADCVPIFLFDQVKKVAGMVHAGWRGTVTGTAEAAIHRMVTHYQSDPANILAGIGPSICLKHYQVGEEVAAAAARAFGKDARQVLWTKNGSSYFDLWTANRLVLERCGVQKIEQANICTYCYNTDWYSHRAEKGKTGRFGALLAIKPVEESRCKR